MLCEKCKSNSATIHITKIYNGKKQQMWVCTNCALEMGASQMPLNMGELFSGMFNQVKPAQEDTHVCPKCGCSFGKFSKTGLLGCSQCYDVMREQLQPVIEGIHGRIQHKGKTPYNMEEEVAQKTRYAVLKEKLEEAVRSEEYETAAKLRDQIRLLEQTEVNTNEVDSAR